MQLTQKIVCEHRNTHNTLTVKNDARRPEKNLILISRVLGLGLGLEPQVLVIITADRRWHIRAIAYMLSRVKKRYKTYYRTLLT